MGILPIPRTPPNPPRRGGLKKAQEGLVQLNRRLRRPIPRTPPNPPRRGGLKKAQEGLVRLKRRPIPA